MDVAENIAYHVQRMQLLSLTPNVYQSNESFVRQVEAITQIPQVLSQEFIDTVDSKYKVNKDTYVSSRNEARIRSNNQSDKVSKKSFADILGEELFIKGSKVNKVNKSETEDYIEREVKTMCNHNPNDENTSLKKMNKRMMVFPSVTIYSCSCCNKGFKFKKNDDGKLEEVKDE